MTIRMMIKRNTAANWTSKNPVLGAGEMGIETDTRRIKYGDGETQWISLPYAGNYQEKLSSGNKLASDLVDDTGNNNKFVTAAEKTTWSAKQPAGDYAENPTVVAIASGDTVVITNNVCYKGSTLTAFSITCPTGTYPFTSQIDFISGTTPTAITYNSTIKWVRGSDDIQENNGVVTFVPVANKEYTIMLYYNGTSWCGVSRGV